VVKHKQHEYSDSQINKVLGKLNYNKVYVIVIIDN